MLADYLRQAREDRPLWLPQLRAAFLKDKNTRPLWLRLTGQDGAQHDFPTAVPRWETEEERAFAAAFLYACVYNLLAVYSGRELRLFFDTTDAELCALYDSLDTVFQLHEKRRHGYGKVVSIASRIAADSGGEAFHFAKADLGEYAPLREPEAERADAPLDEKLRGICAQASGLGLCGVDVGGTDIKLAVSEGERLVCTKEYDWNPALYPTAEEIIGPILWLTRLMRACLAAGRTAVSDTLREKLREALRKDAPLALICEAVTCAEQALGEKAMVLDGVGLSFSDIVIDDRILGGETPKTDGMRRNTALDYEREFAKLSDLKNTLLALCREGGRVHITNDGNMAAFTAAMELAHSADAASLRDGVIAHSLGTDLGTGWVTAAGTIPALPLEMYDLALDLGSFRSRAFPPQDLRSTRNENSGLPGARRYMGQAAVYRLAYQRKSDLLSGFTAEDGGALTIATEPQDLRKPCLEHLMQCAENGDAEAAAVFRDVGENLSVVTQEMEYMLHPAAKARFLFGRFVKRPAVFRLLEEGFCRGVEGVRLVPPDGELAKTPLMRALAQSADATVAQFGQAVGAIYFALT